MERDFYLEASIRSCRQCPLGSLREGTGGIAVPAEPGSKYRQGGLAFMAEAPGRDEDATGRPLVGRAGQTFSELLEAAGIDRDELLLINRVCCRPPGNKLTDYPEALPACSPWVEQSLDVYGPRVIVLMGATALAPVFGAKSKVEFTRGQCRTAYRDNGTIVTYVATYHPAALLRRPSQELFELVANDYRLAAEMLREVGSADVH